MILRLEGPTPASVSAARSQLADLTRSWGCELSELDEHTDNDSRPHEGYDKGADPVSIAALVLAIPGAALAVADLADRILKRRRAEELIATARRQVTGGVTILINIGGAPVSIATLEPDHLLDQNPDATTRATPAGDA